MNAHILCRILLPLVGLLPFAAALAGEFEPVGNTEVIYLKNYEIDLELRTILARQARTSIDIISFSQNTDDIGLPFLKAIRHAQKTRGVKVRSVYDWQVSKFLEAHSDNMAKMMLTDPNLPCPGEVMCAYPIEKLSSGLSITDYIHEKIYVIDGGTPFETVFFSGRGTTGYSAKHADSGFLIRRIHADRPYLGDHLKQVFESVWTQMKRLADKSWVKIPSQVRLVPEALPEWDGERIVKDEANRREVGEILALLREPPKEQAPAMMKDFQFQPKNMQVMTNDLFQQLIDGKVERSAFSNDAHHHLIEDIRSFTGTLELTSYSVGPTEELHQALVDFVRRGNTLNLYTNGWESYKALKLPNGFPAYYTYESVARMLKDTEGSTGKIHLHVLQPDKAQALGRPGYVHRKLISFVPSGKDPKKVYVGSDNFTWSSHAKNDELLVKIQDDRLTDELLSITREEKSAYDLLRPEQVSKLYKNRPLIYRCLRTLVKTLF